MSIGGSLFLIAVGAILYFAVTATLAGIDIATVGLILMIIGVLGLVPGSSCSAAPGATPASPAMLTPRAIRQTSTLVSCFISGILLLPSG